MIRLWAISAFARSSLAVELNPSANDQEGSAAAIIQGESEARLAVR
jgi:hypothetical protein